MKKLTLASLALAVVVSSAAVASEQKAPKASSQATQAAQELDLQNGLKARIEGEKLSLVNPDGSAKPAPDGVYTAKDGQTITQKNGKIVQ